VTLFRPFYAYFTYNVQGATIVQLRDKTSDTGEQIRIAEELHKITKPANVPLLINDRVDVALAAGVEGVHIGQDDIGEQANIVTTRRPTLTSL